MFEEISLSDIITADYSQTILKITHIDKIPLQEELMDLFNELEKSNIGWFIFCEQRKIYQAISNEFVEALAEEIKKISPKKVVEVCAGNGKLSYWLNEFRINCIATDDYSWPSIERNERFVEKISHLEAIAKYSPDLIIGSWIPHKSRIAIDVLDSKCVRNYLDIGNRKNTGIEELWSRTDYIYSNLYSASKLSICRLDYSELLKKGKRCSSVNIFIKI